MIFIPVVFMVTVSAGIFLFLQFGNINRTSIISFLWPESGPTLSVQFELSRLRVRADSFNGEHLSPMLQASHHLETLGLNVAIFRYDELLYQTNGIEGTPIWQEAVENSPGHEAAITWSDTGLAFHYTSPQSGVRLAVVGAVPIRQTGEFIDVSSKNVLKTAFLILLLVSVLLTIIIGVVLSRWLARQLIVPLETLRNTAEAISQGELDKPVAITSNDEIGQTCQSFEVMRKQLQTAQVLRFGTLAIDEAAHHVFVHEKEVLLPNKEFELLLFLAKNPGIVFSKDTLFDRVWGTDALGETATVAVHVNRIREKIEDDTSRPHHIETVWGAGYRFHGK